MKSMMIKALFSIGITALGLQLSAQDFNKAKMDSLFSIYDQYHRGMGSVSLFKDGEEVYQKSIGFADVEKGIPANANTQYRIGSITKMFTAVLFMKLVEEGKISLDQRLSNFYPRVPNADIISMEQLLRHRSGIFNVIAAEDYYAWNTQPITKEDMLEKIIKYEPQFDPGSKAEYSNANYILLTYIIEDLSGESFESLLQNQICEKCGLELTEVGDQIETEKNEALSYFPASPWNLAGETDMSVPIGAGSIVSTPTDLNRFLHCLYDGELVKQASLENMMELKDNFGLGMFTVPFYEKVAYGHTGGIDGFNSNAFYFVEDQFSVAYTSNGMKSPINDLMIGVLSIYYGKDYKLPVFKEVKTMKTAELIKYAGVYASESFPLKITITADNDQLKAQATGQPEFVLDPLGDHKFEFERAGVIMTFDPENDSMSFEQRGMQFDLTKE
jgi:CubicO group peptidase (beta-lactamase class C family)